MFKEICGFLNFNGPLLPEFWLNSLAIEQKVGKSSFSVLVVEQFVGGENKGMYGNGVVVVEPQCDSGSELPTHCVKLRNGYFDFVRVHGRRTLMAVLAHGC
jgi:hypothetical protein